MKPGLFVAYMDVISYCCDLSPRHQPRHQPHDNKSKLFSILHHILHGYDLAPSETRVLLQFLTSRLTLDSSVALCKRVFDQLDPSPDADQSSLFSPNCRNAAVLAVLQLFSSQISDYKSRPQRRFLSNPFFLLFLKADLDLIKHLPKLLTMFFTATQPQFQTTNQRAANIASQCLNIAASMCGKLNSMELSDDGQGYDDPLAFVIDTASMDVHYRDWLDDKQKQDAVGNIPGLIYKVERFENRFLTIVGKSERLQSQHAQLVLQIKSSVATPLELPKRYGFSTQ